jgi:protein-disulfide isomerase
MKENIDTNAQQKEDTFTINKHTLWMYSTFLLLAVVVIGGFAVFSGNGGAPTGNVVANNPTPTAPPAQPSQVTASADDDARIGSPNAPVEIIEFSDFQCPFCSRAAPTVKQVLAEYGDKVTFVYRDFPLDSIHPFATPAAIAAECVREEGGDESYFEYHDKIFAGQASLSDANLKAWAKELGYNIDSCLDSQKYLDEVKKDLADAQAAGGRGTPYFVINGKPLSGAQPLSAFKQIIDAELA